MMQPHRAARVRFKSLASKPHTPLGLFGLALALLFVGSPVLVAPQSASPDLAQQIFDVMTKIPGAKPATRPVHAKGIVCEGTFTATPAAAGLSRAEHFQGKPVKGNGSFF
jgi:catalase